MVVWMRAGEPEESMKEQHKKTAFGRFFRSPLNILTYGSVGAMGIFLLCFKLWTGYGGKTEWRAPAYYIEAASHSIGSFAVILAYLGVMFLLALVIESQIKNFLILARKKEGRLAWAGKDSAYGILRNGGKMIWQAFLTAAPAFIMVFLMSFVLGEMNAVDRARLVDTSLLGMEHLLFGGYVFAILGAISYPAFLIQFIIFSFTNLVCILILSALLLAYFDPRILREMIAAFCFCMLLMVPLWVSVPALSPQDRFINNVYQLPVSADIAAAVGTYHPDPQIVDFLASIRVDKNGLADMPTSTMPSAHAAWAVFVGYYLFRAKKWLGWIALPFLLASTAGTVILAQHYSIDILIGAFLAAFAVWVAASVTSREEVREVL